MVFQKIKIDSHFDITWITATHVNISPSNNDLGLTFGYHPSIKWMKRNTQIIFQKPWENLSILDVKSHFCRWVHLLKESYVIATIIYLWVMPHMRQSEGIPSIVITRDTIMHSQWNKWIASRYSNNRLYFHDKQFSACRFSKAWTHDRSKVQLGRLNCFVFNLSLRMFW